MHYLWVESPGVTKSCIIEICSEALEFIVQLLSNMLGGYS